MMLNRSFLVFSVLVVDLPFSLNVIMSKLLLNIMFISLFFFYFVIYQILAN